MKTNDLWQQEVKKYFKEFIEIRDQSDEQVAELSRKLGIDIAIDLKGFTEDARTGIFANHAAPIQINYLGYPGTMSADYIDYIIADKVVIPEESQTYYTEKVLYLPNCYQPNIRTRKISEKIILRKDVGLPENGIVYCSFNSIYKITPDMFSAWLNILRQVENSVLWILNTSDTARNELIEFAKDQGIDSSRIIFAPHLSIEEHLKRISLADVFLDTYPCNAHTTASDSIRMGVPIVTLIGQSFASRVAASILTAVNMTDLITTNTDDYKYL
jgi:predicted O-linked N-acetylglucosamine transferase (SPINDLY family)